MPSLSTWCLGSGSPVDFARLIEDGDFSGTFLDASVSEMALRELLTVLRRPIVGMEAPCPAGRTQRAPRLAAQDREERHAAINSTLKTLQLASDQNAGVVVVKLGSIDALRSKWPRVSRAFSTGQWDDDDAERLHEERARWSETALDWARFGLEPLLARAAGLQVRIALANRPRWFQIPDDPEITYLLEEFRGAPLTIWLDPAARHARKALDPSSGLREQDSKLLAGIWLSDACGLMTGLPWKIGEVNHAEVLSALPANALRVTHASPLARRSELIATARG